MIDYTAKPFFITPSKKRIEDFNALIDRKYDVTITKWLRKGWEIFKKDAGYTIAFAIIGAILYGLASILIPFGIGGMVIGIPLSAGFMIIGLMLYRKQQTEFARYFWGFRHLVPLLFYSIVSTVFIAIGIILLVIPGIYLVVAYLFAPYLIVDKNIDFWPAMEISRRKVNKHWFGMFAFCLALLFINLLGSLPMFLGLFVTVPFSLYAGAAAYEDIFREDSAAEALVPDPVQ